MLVFVAAVGFVMVRYYHPAENGWPYDTQTYVLLCLLLGGWPIWRHLKPRPIPSMRVIGWISCGAAVYATLLAASLPGRKGVETYEIALHAYSVVTLALYLEIARGLLERGTHRSDLVPEARSLRPSRVRPAAPR
jgi:hypothetical protein